MKILIVTDAWTPQTNGVVTTMTQVVSHLERVGHEVKVLHPGLYRSFPLPGYAEIPLVYYAKNFANHIVEFSPDAVHIVTEGPLGLRARAFCLKRGWPFTTSFHTKFAEYLNERLPFIPVSFGYKFLRYFHGPARNTLVSTDSMIEELASRGFKNLYKWNRGVDTELFHPKFQQDLGLPKPIYLYVGRVAVEKNLPAFLDLDLPGTKVVVGKGPDLESLQKHYPQVQFTGRKVGQDLARYFASADVFVFPSLTDTYGLVMLESLAAGTPVAAYPVTGPVDLLTATTGAMNPDLKVAIQSALSLNRQDCHIYAQNFSWAVCAETFMQGLVGIEAAGLEVVHS